MQNRFGTILRLPAVDEGVLVLEVKQEPKLHARVGDSKTDIVAHSEINSGHEVRVIVTVEHTPDLVMGPTSLTFGVVGFLPLSLNCVLNELQRSAAERVDAYAHLVAVSTVPVDQVHLFGSATFYEDE